MTVKKYNELIKKQSEMMDALLKKCQVFFAFSNEQLKRNREKAGLMETRLTAIQGGGFLPSSKLEEFDKGYTEIGQWLDEQTKALKLEDAEIEYHLSNYECYYTIDISDAMDATNNKYSKERVWRVFEKTKHKYLDC
jgi:hypothetical protein